MKWFFFWMLLLFVSEGWGQKYDCVLSGEVEGLKKGDVFFLAIADDKSDKIKQTERIAVTQDNCFRHVFPCKEDCQAFLIHYPAERLPMDFSDGFWSENYKELFLTPGEYCIKGDLKHWTRAEIRGGIYQGAVCDYCRLKDSLTELTKQATQEFSVLEKPSPGDQNRYSVRIMKLQNQHVKALLEFVRSVPDSKYAAWEYYSMIDFFSDRTMKLMKHPFYQSPETMSQVYLSFSPEIKASKYGLLIRKFIGNKMALADGKKLPVFRLKDTEGKILRSSDFKQQYLLLEFWDSFCEPCMECMPWVKRLHERYGGQGLSVVGISCDRRTEDCLKTLGKHECTWRQVCCGQWEENKNIMEKYTVGAFPTFILAGPDGKIRIMGTSGITLKEIETYLETHLK